jgi:hypothetical protein
MFVKALHEPETVALPVLLASTLQTTGLPDPPPVALSEMVSPGAYTTGEVGWVNVMICALSCVIPVVLPPPPHPAMSMAKTNQPAKMMAKLEVKAPRRHNPRAMDETNVATKLRMAFSFILLR